MADAADFQIMVNFHGSTIPRGWSREFPHLMSMEAVFGAEQDKFRQAFTTRAAWLNTVLPFTRNVIGPMDYTPVTFTDVRYPRTTTNAHEPAQSVVFESGIQHFADSVEAGIARCRQRKAVPGAGACGVGRDARDCRGARRVRRHCPPRRPDLVRRRSQRGHGDDCETAARVAGNGSWTMTLIGDGAVDPEFKTRRGR